MDPAVLRVGVLTPHAAAGPEVELPEMASGRVVAAVARVQPPDTEAERTPPSSASGLRALAALSVLSRAASRFGDGSVDVVVHASTSTSYVLGHEAEAQLMKSLQYTFGVPVVASGASALQALRTYGSQRIVLVHPPWFDDEIDRLGLRFFADEGFDVSLSKADKLPDDPAQVRPEQVVDWVIRHVPTEADAVFIGGNGFRAAEAIEELERRTGLLVLESNQVLLWSILTAVAMSWEVDGYGRLFRTAGHLAASGRLARATPSSPLHRAQQVERGHTPVDCLPKKSLDITTE